MNLGLYKRESLRSGDATKVGDAVIDQFQRTHGALTAWQEVEHTDDGHHTDITADSITVDGDIIVDGGISSPDGTIPIGDGGVVIGNLPIGQVPGQGPQAPGYGIQMGPWRIVSDAATSPGTPTYPSLAFQFLNEVLGPYLFRFLRAAANDWALTPVTGALLRLGRGFPGERLASIDTDKIGVLGAATVGSVSSQGDVTSQANIRCVNEMSCDVLRIPLASSRIYEQGRTVALGFWQDAPYVPGNYVTVTGLPWTVPSAGWMYRYTLIGKTIMVQFRFTNTSVPANAQWGLATSLPPGLQFTSQMTTANLAPMTYVSNNGVVTGGAYVYAWAATQWAIALPSGSWTPSAGTTHVYGAFFAEVL